MYIYIYAQCESAYCKRIHPPPYREMRSAPLFSPSHSSNFAIPHTRILAFYFILVFLFTYIKPKPSTHPPIHSSSEWAGIKWNFSNKEQVTTHHITLERHNFFLLGKFSLFFFSFYSSTFKLNYYFFFRLSALGKSPACLSIAGSGLLFLSDEACMQMIPFDYRNTHRCTRRVKNKKVDQSRPTKKKLNGIIPKTP